MMPWIRTLRTLRESRPLVVVVVFIALMLDVLMMTSIDPILPAMLRKLDERNRARLAGTDSLTVLDVPCSCSLVPMTEQTARNVNVACKCHGNDWHFDVNCAGDSVQTLEPQFIRGPHIPMLHNGITIDLKLCNISTLTQDSLARIVCREFDAHNSNKNCDSTLDGGYNYDTASTIPADKEDDHNDDSADDANMAQSTEIGVMVAAKPATELVSNVAVGYLVDRVGHRYPMVIGCLFNFVSTVGFAYAKSFWMLMLTRIAQAVGSSLSVVAGLVFLASVYTDDAERAKASSRAFSGISMGVILGYPYGSTVYQFLGREAPFLILAAATVADGGLRMVLVSPDTRIREEPVTCRQSCTLLTDGYILLGLGSVFLTHFGLGVFLATGPAWMLDELHAEQWTIGVVLAVAVVFHVAAQIITGIFAVKLGRWLFYFCGMVFFAAGIASYPFCKSIWMVLGPEAAVRIGHGTVLCVISPLLGHIVDLRHGSQYGTVYGLYTASYNLGLSLGSVGAGFAIKLLSFSWIYWSTAVAIGIYSFTAFAFRNPRSKQPLMAVNHGVHSYGAVSRPPETA